MPADEHVRRGHPSKFAHLCRGSSEGPTCLSFPVLLGLIIAIGIVEASHKTHQQSLLSTGHFVCSLGYQASSLAATTVGMIILIAASEIVPDSYCSPLSGPS